MTGEDYEARKTGADQPGMHEPECLAPCCPWMPQPCDCQCDCDRLRSAYRRGYNARATSAAHSYQMFGIPEFNQHGEGTNP